MKLIDYLLDNSHKRYYMTFFALAMMMLVELCYETIMSNYVTNFRAMADVLSFVEYPVVQKAFAGRLLFNAIDYELVQNRLWIIISHTFTVRDVIVIVLFVILTFNDLQGTLHKMIKRCLFLTALSFSVKTIVFFGSFIYASMGLTTSIAISRFVLGAGIYKFMSIITIIYMLVTVTVTFFRTYLTRQ